MTFDFSDTNQQFTIFLLVIAIGVTTCGVATKCSDSAEWRANAEVRKACVYKTGNPECKP